MKSKKRKKEHISKSAKIVIIGAGIGGLSTALSLQQAGFTNVHVYERQRNPDRINGDSKKKQNHGYGLTLTYNPKGPLAKLGILEELARRDTPSRSHYIFSPDGSVMGYFGNAFVPNRGHGQRGNLRVPRHVVRDVMLQRIKTNKENSNGVKIYWDEKLKHLETSQDCNGDNKVTIWLEDGRIIKDIDLLIGADGIRSLVRTQAQLQNPALETPQLRYLKIFLILGISNLDHPLLDERGFYTLDGTHRLFIMPYEQNKNKFRGKNSRKTMWQLSFFLDNEQEAIKLSNASENALLVEVKRRIANWHAPVLDMVVSTDEESVWGTGLMDQPNILHLHKKSKEVQPIVLMGDAIHPMSPFKGQGANQALTDGPALTDWLLKSKFSSALLGFEREMHLRTRPKVLASREAALTFHSKEIMNEKGQHSFAGVKTDCIDLLRIELKKRGIDASSAKDLDDKVRNVILEFGFGVDSSSLSEGGKNQNISGDVLEKLKQKALQYAEIGDTSGLRNISIKFSCSIIQTAKENVSGRSCLFLAALGGHFHLTDWLLNEAGVLEVEGIDMAQLESINEENGQNPIHAAVLGRNADVLSIIIQKCYEVGIIHWLNMKDEKDNTPLMLVREIFHDKTNQELFLSILTR